MKRSQFIDEDGNFDEDAYYAEGDRKYDERCDEIICSQDYSKCPERTSEDDCKLKPYKDGDLRRCWHILKCPLGKNRKSQEG